MLQCWRRCTHTCKEQAGGGKVGCRVLLFVRVPFGLKSNVVQSWDHITTTLCRGGFVCYEEDPDMWMRPRVKPNGDTESISYAV